MVAYTAGHPAWEPLRRFAKQVHNGEYVPVESVDIGLRREEGVRRFAEYIVNGEKVL